MVHGVTGYFLERARFERRLSMLMVAVSMVSLGLLGLAEQGRQVGVGQEVSWIDDIRAWGATPVGRRGRAFPT